jgi:hypothetical protein
MELLKFSDSPKSSRRGKNPAAFIGAGIMVAVMGLSSTLAGTISINSGRTVEFGQGIVSTAACDASISITPVSSYSYSADTFTVSSVKISQVGWDSGVSGVVTADGRGCRGQVLELRAYGASSTPLLFHSDTASTSALVLYIPETSTVASGSPATISATNFNVGLYDLTDGAVTGNVAQSPTLIIEGKMADGSPTDNSAADSMSFTIGSLKLSSTVQRLTLESRSPRADSDEDD